jgi:hypothetical protein
MILDNQPHRTYDGPHDHEILERAMTRAPQLKIAGGRGRRCSAALVILLGGAACATGSVGWEGLPRADKELWLRCEQPVLRVQCGPDPASTVINHRFCEEELTKRFLKQPTSEQRHGWLKDQGCPRELVWPANVRYDGSRGSSPPS